MIRTPSSLRESFGLTPLLDDLKLLTPSRSIDLWLSRLRIRFVTTLDVSATKSRPHFVHLYLAGNRRKVDCVTDMSWALRMWSSIWLERALESASEEDLGKLLQVASSFDLADAFTKISWMIISKQVGPLESRAREHDRVITADMLGKAR